MARVTLQNAKQREALESMRSGTAMVAAASPKPPTSLSETSRRTATHAISTSPLETGCRPRPRACEMHRRGEAALRRPGAHVIPYGAVDRGRMPRTPCRERSLANSDTTIPGWQGVFRGIHHDRARLVRAGWIPCCHRTPAGIDSVSYDRVVGKLWIYESMIRFSS